MNLPAKLSTKDWSYQKKKEFVQHYRPVVDDWYEAVISIKEKKEYLEDCQSWEEWCVEYCGLTADGIRLRIKRFEERELRKSLPEKTFENTRRICSPPNTSVSESQENLLKAQQQKIDALKGKMARKLPQGMVIDLLGITPDVRNLVSKLTRELEKLLAESAFAASDQFRHCVAEARQINKLLQPELPGFENMTARQRSRGTEAEVIEFCVNLGLTKEDGQWFFLKCEGCGWKNNGKAILDWRSTVRAWEKLRTVFPSHRKGSSGNGKISGAEIMVRQKELEAAVQQMTTIRNSYSENQKWSDKDRQRFLALKIRRDELKQLLGIKV